MKSIWHLSVMKNQCVNLKSSLRAEPFFLQSTVIVYSTFLFLVTFLNKPHFPWALDLFRLMFHSHNAGRVRRPGKAPLITTLKSIIPRLLAPVLTMYTTNQPKLAYFAASSLPDTRYKLFEMYSSLKMSWIFNLFSFLILGNSSKKIETPWARSNIHWIRLAVSL